MPSVVVSGYNEDPFERIMYEAGWVPAPRLDRNTTIPKVTEPGSVLILGGKGYVPGSNALRGDILRRYLETYMGPLDKQKMDADSFTASAKALGILRKEAFTPVIADPLPTPEMTTEQKRQADYEEYLKRIKASGDPFEAKLLGEDFLSKWGMK